MAYTSPNLNPSGATFAQFQAGGADGLLERLIAANMGGTSPPGAPTVAASGGGSSGGQLPAATYSIRVTETNGLGETTASPAVSVAVAAGNIPKVTFAPLQSGNVARNVYVGTSAGSEVLYASGVATGTCNLSASIPTGSYAVSVPTTNSTGLLGFALTGGVANRKLDALRACEHRRLQSVWDGLVHLAGQFNRGEAIPFDGAIAKLREAHTVFAALAEVCAEVGALMDANAGHIATVANGIGQQTKVRRWP